MYLLRLVVEQGLESLDFGFGCSSCLSFCIGSCGFLFGPQGLGLSSICLSVRSSIRLFCT